jgi:hypothetical protein
MSGYSLWTQASNALSQLNPTGDELEAQACLELFSTAVTPADYTAGQYIRLQAPYRQESDMPRKMACRCFVLMGCTTDACCTISIHGWRRGQGAEGRAALPMSVGASCLIATCLATSDYCSHLPLCRVGCQDPSKLTVPHAPLTADTSCPLCLQSGLPLCLRLPSGGLRLPAMPCWRYCKGRPAGRVRRCI